MQTPYQTPGATQVPQQYAVPAKLTFMQTLFSFKGRIPRGTWWLFYVLTVIVFIVLISGLSATVFASAVSSVQEVQDAGGSQAEMEAAAGASTGAGIGAILMLLLLVPFYWIFFALNAKRCHNSDKSGWFQLIPFYNLILCGFIAGTPGPNRFGNNPLGQ